MQKQFWVLGIVQLPRSKKLRVRILSSNHVLGRGQKLTILFAHKLQEVVEGVRTILGDKEVINFYRANRLIILEGELHEALCWMFADARTRRFSAKRRRTEGKTAPKRPRSL